MDLSSRPSRQFVIEVVYVTFKVRILDLPIKVSQR